MSTAVERLKARRAKIKANSGSDVDIAKIPNGTSKWRILPGWRTEDSEERPQAEFYLPYGEHWIKHPFKKTDSGRLKALAKLPSRAIAYGEDCELGKAVEEASMMASSEEVVEALKEAKASTRYLFNALCIEGPDKDKVVVLDCPSSVADAIMMEAEQDEDWIDGKVEEPDCVRADAGCIFIIERSGTGRNDTKYSVNANTRKKQPVDEDILKQRTDLDGMLDYSPDEFSRAMSALAVVTGFDTGDRPALEGEPVDNKPRIDFDDTVDAEYEDTDVDPLADAGMAEAA